MWRPICTFRSARIWQTKLADCRRRWAFSSTGRWPCPKYGTAHRNWTKQSANRHDWNGPHSPDPNGPEVSSNIFLIFKKYFSFIFVRIFFMTYLCAHPIFERSHQNCPTQLNCSADWNCNRTHSYYDPSTFSSICPNLVPRFSVSYRRWHWPTGDCHWTRPHRWCPTYDRKWFSQIYHRMRPKFWLIYRQLCKQTKNDYLNNFFFFLNRHLHELANHSPFGLNLTAETAFVWPANVNFSV